VVFLVFALGLPNLKIDYYRLPILDYLKDLSLLIVLIVPNQQIEVRNFAVAPMFVDLPQNL
jgi:hypothetical protein